MHQNIHGSAPNSPAATGLRETSGPTTLAVGAIAKGQIIVSDATTGAIEGDAARTTKLDGLPSDAQSAAQVATAANAAAQDDENILAALATADSSVDVNAQPVTNAADATTPQGLVTLKQLQAVAAGILTKQTADYATAAALPTYVATAQTLTMTALGPITIDGHALVTGDLGKRVLVRHGPAGESSHADIGIYTITTVGVALVSATVLTRAFDQNAAEEFNGAYLAVANGVVNTGTKWLCSATEPVTPGTTAIAYFSAPSPGDVQAGTGLTLTGDTLSVNYGTSAGTALQGNAAPNAHHATHQSGGSDEIATVTAANGAIPKAGANGRIDQFVTAPYNTRICITESCTINPPLFASSMRVEAVGGGGGGGGTDGVAGGGGGGGGGLGFQSGQAINSTMPVVITIGQGGAAAVGSGAGGNGTSTTVVCNSTTTTGPLGAGGAAGAAGAQGAGGAGGHGGGFGGDGGGGGGAVTNGGGGGGGGGVSFNGGNGNSNGTAGTAGTTSGSPNSGTGGTGAAGANATVGVRCGGGGGGASTTKAASAGQPGWVILLFT